MNYDGLQLFAIKIKILIKKYYVTFNLKTLNGFLVCIERISKINKSFIFEQVKLKFAFSRSRLTPKYNILCYEDVCCIGFSVITFLCS